MGRKYAHVIKRNMLRKESIVINFVVHVKSEFKKQRGLAYYAAK